MARLVAWMARLSAALLAAFVAGFLLFTGQVQRYPVGQAQTADGIVALTGGQERIAEAIRLLAAHRAERLLISGVNPRTTRGDLQRLVRQNGRIFECCIDIGYAAQDTIGNAYETRDWAIERGFKRIIVVTASYHMPRSLAELGRAMPGVQLIAHPVVPDDFAVETWWRHPGTARILLSEYLKYLPSMLRLSTGLVLEPRPPADKGGPVLSDTAGLPSL